MLQSSECDGRWRIRIRSAFGLLAAGLVSGGTLAAEADAQVVPDPFPAPIVKGTITVELEEIASSLVAPDALLDPGDGSGRLFVLDQPGEIRLIEKDVLAPTPYLDLTAQVGPLPFFSERGLIGMAFHPDFANAGAPGAGRFYTHHSEPVSGTADFTVALTPGNTMDHQAVITEWTVSDPAAGVFAGTQREILRIDQPQGNHNGGQLAFAPDGTLLIGLGDGGGSNDTGSGHGGAGNGQDRTTIHGNVLRIDPLGSNGVNGQYGIPADNPFVGSGTILPEAFVTGVRNAYRFSIDVDPTTSAATLWLADVGQGTIEEVNRLSLLADAGANLGWNLKEGSLRFDPASGGVIGDTTGLPAGLVDPFAEYDHSEGSAVIGGFVYRGSAIPSLVGKYVFGDFANPGTGAGRIFALDLVTGVLEEVRIGLDDRGVGAVIKGFGQDASGELYVMGGGGIPPLGQLGRVWRIVAVPEPSIAVLASCAAFFALRRRRQSASSMRRSKTNSFVR